MKQNIKDIVKYKYTKKFELKKELKKKILKSIIQNSFLANIYKVYAQFKLDKINKNNRFNKSKKICLLIGRKRGVLKKFNLSRHQIKQFNIRSKLQNIKLKSW